MSLQHRIAVIVPSTINGNQSASTDVIAKWTSAAKVKFARLFGGFTAHNAVGGWVSQELGLIEESVTVVTSYTDEGGLEFVETVKEFAASMAEALGQEAVSVEVDHELEFISPLAVA